MIKLVSDDKNVQQYSPMIIHQHVVCHVYVLPPYILPPPFSLSLSLPLLQFATDSLILYHSSGHTINCPMEEGVSGAAKNKYVRGAVKSSVRLGYQQLMTASNSPIVGLVCLLYSWCFILKLST